MVSTQSAAHIGLASPAPAFSAIDCVQPFHRKSAFESYFRRKADRLSAI
jgi:hypothetical protein